MFKSVRFVNPTQYLNKIEEPNLVGLTGFAGSVCAAQFANAIIDISKNAIVFFIAY